MAGRRGPRNGEYGYRYGRRNYLVVTGQGLVAQDGPWHLVAVPAWDKPGWHNFKLYFDEAASKNMFNVSVSKGAVAMKRDTKLLDEHHAGILDWVDRVAGAYINGDVGLKPERGIEMVYRTKLGWRKASDIKD